MNLIRSVLEIGQTRRSLPPRKKATFGMSRITVTSVLLIALGITQNSIRAEERRRFKADLQTASRLVEAPAGRCDDEPGKSPVVGLLEVVGTGDASLLGPVIDEQSHCVRQDLSFFNGRFALTNAGHLTIEGRYNGQLVPTFDNDSHFLIMGNICVSGGTVGHIENDCRAGHFEPARGITSLATGEATILLDQSIGVEGPN
jgi:hypothetical protein